MRVRNAGKHNRLVSSRGVVLIAVLLFMAAIVPVTILILDSVRLESLIPVNENYVEIADKQAELGFYEAVALIMEDQHLLGVDPSREIPDDYQDPLIGVQDYIYQPSDDNPGFIYGLVAGTHDIDYLAEPWARHPENRTYFILERSLENFDDPILDPLGLNLDPGNDLVSSVPARWQLQDIPIGLDDFGELIEDYYNDIGDEPGLMPVYENYRIGLDDRTPIGARHLAPHSITQYDDSDADDAFDWPIVDYTIVDGSSHSDWALGAELDWMVSPADADYVWPNQYPRPASYFRNAPPNGVDNYAPENLVYDSMYDGNESTNQYLPNAELQEAVVKSTWANTFFGNPYTNNKEYKPAPGSVYPAPIGSEGDVLPAWHETIISDESGRFPINLLLNIIFSSHNYDYVDDGSQEAPVVERDQWDYYLDYDDPITDGDHPNHYGYMLAKDMVISLLLTDQDLRGQSPAPRDTPINAYQYYQPKAEWILRQMLYKRSKIDEKTDYNADGDFDETFGENGAYPALDILDGNGRRGDGADMWDGTWNIYNDPKSILSDYARDSEPSLDARPTIAEFGRLNQRVTVYSFDTEFIADFEGIPDVNASGTIVRYNINTIPEDDDLSTPGNEAAGFNILSSKIGSERAKSIIRWRNGEVDLNGDGDLDDEYIEQPVKVPLDDEPITTLTYRERNHPNFQDPLLPTAAGYSNHILFDPDYLNIPNLGSLLTIPMSVTTSQIIYSSFDGSGLDIYRHYPGSALPDVLLLNAVGDDYQSPNLDPFGSEFVYERYNQDLNPSDLYDATSTVPPVTNNLGIDGFHPSYNANGQRICYVGESGGENEIFTANADGSGAAPITDAITTLVIPDEFELGSFVNGLGGPNILPDTLLLEVCAPDYSPGPLGTDWIVFAGGPGPAPLDFANDYSRIMRINDDGSGLVPLTQTGGGSNGIFDMCPVFSHNADWVIFTRINFTTEPVNIFDLMGMVSLWAVRSNGGFAYQLPIRDPDSGSGAPVLFPIQPTVHPDGDFLAFVAFRMLGGPLSFNIYSVPTEGLLTSSPVPVDANLIILSGAIAAGDEGIAWCPDWGYGPTILAEQADYDAGFRDPSPITMTGIDPVDRELLAAELQEASIALRIDLGNDSYQQFKLKHYPGVSSLQVKALRDIYDAFCVRDPLVYNPGSDNFVLQAYSPRININTAPRPVLRTILLTMFQGPVWDASFDGFTTGPAPRGNDPFGAGIRPINLATTIGETDIGERLLAIQIADTYAHQIDEYRRWVYNNKGEAGITQETVPDKLALLVGADADNRYNFRGNPFYPIDLDNNPDSIDKPFHDPAPPFRSVADLFRVMLYLDLGPDWRAEGIESIYGPDEADLPESLDASSFNPAGGITALDVWGPIYIEAGELTVSHGGGGFGATGTYILPGFENHESIRSLPLGDFGNLYLHSQFRLFSADDFKRVEQYFTTRTYVYRIESRGVVRIGSGVNRMDITRDKYWIVSVNREAAAGYDDDGDPGDSDGTTSDSFGLFHADPGKWYSVIAFEEQQQGGFKLTRDNFTPW